MADDYAGTTTRGERCPSCGQPLVLGVCMLCKRRPPKAAPAPANVSMPVMIPSTPTGATTTIAGHTIAPTATVSAPPSTDERFHAVEATPPVPPTRPVPPTPPVPPSEHPRADRMQTLLAVAIGLLVVTLPT